ncbi:MAG: SRPBCC domain-containing protein [Acidimicrobiales bacterium]
MTVTNVQRDHEVLTMTISAEFNVSPERVWQLWEDPRQLERWWGPPVYPATVTAHDLTPGGSVLYHMTGPGGDQPHGWWRILKVDAPHSLEFENGLADASGAPNLDVPFMIVRVSISALSEGVTRMDVESTYPTLAAMEMFMSMGMEEGMKGAMSQIDALL